MFLHRKIASLLLPALLLASPTCYAGGVGSYGIESTPLAIADIETALTATTGTTAADAPAPQGAPRLDTPFQTDLSTITVHGKVTEKDGRGLAGVPVTDGINFTVTGRDGSYSLLTNRTADFIYISLPSGYHVPMNGPLPHIYHRLGSKDGKKRRFDFELTKMAGPDDKHVTILIADPQIYFDEEVPLFRTGARDLKELRMREYKDTPVYGLVAGDIIGEIATDKRFFDTVNRVLYDTDIPFFYAIGNHDMDLDVRSNDGSKETFKTIYGPTYYSFNRGQAHYVVLDDIFLLARSYLYAGYLEERQLAWLEQDLALVPEGSTVVVCLHIPTYSREARSGNWGAESTMKVMNNRKHLHEILAPYKAHIMSAHEHYNENYPLKKNLYEHVHAPISGLFWQSYWCMDGTPGGYAVYEFDGPEVKWYYKGFGYPKDFQFNAYPVGENREKPDCVTANVWNWDEGWKVEWSENGRPMGEMTRYTGYDPTIWNDVTANGDNYRHKYLGSAPTEHMFFAKPASPDSEVTIEVTDRFGQKYIWKNRE